MDRNQQAVVTNERVHVPPCRFCCILMPTHRSNDLSRSHHSSSSSSSLSLRSFANLFVQQFFFTQSTTLDTLRASAQDLSTDQPIHGSFLPDRKLSHLPDGGTSCYICQKMQDRKPAWRQEGGTNICKLCDNHYCNTHKNHNIDHVCEMNHDTYCRKQRHREDHAPTHIFRNLAEREQWIAQYGTKNVAGVFQDSDDLED